MLDKYSTEAGEPVSMSPDTAKAGSSATKRTYLMRFVPTRLVSPIALVILWEIASRTGIIPPRIIDAPSVVAATFWSLLASGELIYNLWVSLQRVLAGLALGVSLGAVLALVAGLSRLGELAIDPPMHIFRTLPVLALVPLFILWFGIGELPKVLMIAMGTLFPVYLNLFAGIRGVDVKLIEAGRTLGLDRTGLIAHVVLPGALPAFLTGLRYSLAIAWLILVVVEQINATEGLGYMVNNARDFMQMDVIVVCLMVYALLGLLSDFVVRQIESRSLAWRPSFIKA